MLSLKVRNFKWRRGKWKWIACQSNNEDKAEEKESNDSEIKKEEDDKYKIKSMARINYLVPVINPLNKLAN